MRKRKPKIELDPSDLRRLMVSGEWENGYEPEVYLDGNKLSIVKRRDDYNDSLSSVYNFDYTNHRCIRFDVFLPEDKKEANNLSIYAVNATDKILSYSQSLRKIRKGVQKPKYCIDSQNIENGEMQISGWVAYPGNTEIYVTDIHGNRISAVVERSPREDILNLFKFMHLSEDSGFSVNFKYDGLAEAILVFDGGQTKSEYKIAFSFTGKIDRKISLLTGDLGEKITKVKNKVHSVQVKVKRRINRIPENNTYEKWYLSHKPGEEELARQRKEIFAWNPKFSIVIPLYKTPINFLEALIQSIQSQTYTNWELCFSDGSGENSPLTEYLNDIVKKDNRIKVVYDGVQKQISDNTNAAISIATGDFIVFADHDDELVPESLYECVKVLNEKREIEMIYTDEDKIDFDSKSYFEPHFKPDFNWGLLCTQNYICHLCVVKKSLVEKAGLLRTEYNGAQDFDFVLRCAENTDSSKIHHIPKILYHWRCHSGSTAVNQGSKMYAFEAGRKAVQSHFDRIHVPAKASNSICLGLYRTEFIQNEEPMISVVIIHEQKSDRIHQAIQSIMNNRYSNKEIIVVDACNKTNEQQAEFNRAIKENAKCNISILHWDDELNEAEIRNYAVRNANGEYILFLDCNCASTNLNLLNEMSGSFMQGGIGAVGARIYSEDNKIRHAGVVIGIGGLAGYCYAGKEGTDIGFFGGSLSTHDYSAVSGDCMMVRKTDFEKVEGFNSEFKTLLWDLDFCLRLRECGSRVMYNPYAEGFYCDRIRVFSEQVEEVRCEIKQFKDKWHIYYENGDPNYNCHLTLDDNSFAIVNQIYSDKIENE